MTCICRMRGLGRQGFLARRVVAPHEKRMRLRGRADDEKQRQSEACDELSPDDGESRELAMLAARRRK